MLGKHYNNFYIPLRHAQCPLECYGSGLLVVQRLRLSIQFSVHRFIPGWGTKTLYSVQQLKKRLKIQLRRQLSKPSIPHIYLVTLHQTHTHTHPHTCTVSFVSCITPIILQTESMDHSLGNTNLAHQQLVKGRENP